MRQGKLIEEGSNEELLSDPDGAYWALVNAQQLTLGEKVDEEEEQLADKALDTVVSELNEAIERPADSTTNTYKPVGIMRSFGLFLWEQRRLWQVYIVMLIAVAGAACQYQFIYEMFGLVLTAQPRIPYLPISLHT